MPIISPYGSWKSPISSDLIIGSSIRLGELQVEAGVLYWLEGRPQEKGRNVLVRRLPDGKVEDMTPADFNVRSRVHEYGGGAYVVSSGIIYFVNFQDQQIYRQVPGKMPERLSNNTNRRYADFIVDEKRQQLITVFEDFERPNEEPHSGISRISLSGDSVERSLIAGADFHAAPRISPGGQFLAWMQWNHPNMPWDGTELCLARLDEEGEVAEASTIAGNRGEAICLPEWAPNGVLHYVSDKSGWWNIYRYLNYDFLGDADGNSEIVYESAAEFGLPHWVFRQSAYAFLNSGAILASYFENGKSQLGVIDTNHHGLTGLSLPFSYVSNVRTCEGMAYFLAASPESPSALVAFDVKSGDLEIIRRSANVNIDPGYVSVPQALEYPTENGLSAHAFYYPPANKDYCAPTGELPPVIVEIHGGPTAATYPVFSLGILYWTSRGFGVLDVNYGGSTGYGREYRQRLNGAWGIVDVDDCVNGARYLVEKGLADPGRLAITGGSAGGYTTLCALTFKDTFSAGASHYGVSDLQALDEDTHKFESRYTYSLVPKDQYQARSPIFHTDRLNTPVAFFQGLEDKIVPPNQAEKMVIALREKKLPVAYVTFEGEGHGFRQGENIKRALEGEFYFYSRIFGFTPADQLIPIDIENLD